MAKFEIEVIKTSQSSYLTIVEAENRHQAGNLAVSEAIEAFNGPDDAWKYVDISCDYEINRIKEIT